MQYEYDSWNRIQKMTYPDGEEVHYDYNLGRCYPNHLNLVDTVRMAYHKNGRIARKNVFALTMLPTQMGVTNYNRRYDYSGQRNTLSNVYDSVANTSQNFSWDNSGNMVAQNGRSLSWTEDNRLLTVTDNEWFSYYQYDAGGDRTYKLPYLKTYSNRSGRRSVYWAPEHSTLYASPYLVVTPRGYTKHYYAESERITSQIGRGKFPVLTSPVTDTATANRKVRRADSLVLAFNSSITDTSAQLAYLASLTNRQNDTCEAYWYHSDHLGSSSWITDSAGNPVQHLHYLPWGEDFVNQRLNSFDGVRYTFSAKERDAETGLSYFGARYYSSDLSVWLSVDPMGDKYPSMSPYVYCADNPVKLTDPDGRWIPGLDEDNNIIVTREEGDDINSFKKFMGSAYSDDETNNMYGQMQNGRINLTKTYGKEFQIMTDAINDAYNDPTFEDNKNYNCWGMAIAVTKCVKVQGNGPDDLDGVGRNLNSLEQFDNCLSNGYSQGGQESASVGKTVLRFGNVENKSHGAVYMGKDRSGTEYVFTKNGWVKRPEISTTERMLMENRYGGNCDRSGTTGQGYYTRKTKRR